eukprot:3122795-Pleurochrysis_carterae.AAC.1
MTRRSVRQMQGGEEAKKGGEAYGATRVEATGNWGSEEELEVRVGLGLGFGVGGGSGEVVWGRVWGKRSALKEACGRAWRQDSDWDRYTDLRWTE